MQTELDNLLTKVIKSWKEAARYDAQDEMSDRDRVSTKSAWARAEILEAELRNMIKELKC